MKYKEEKSMREMSVKLDFLSFVQPSIYPHSALMSDMRPQSSLGIGCVECRPPPTLSRQVGGLVCRH